MAVAEVKTAMVLSGLDAEWHEVVHPRFNLTRLSRPKSRNSCNSRCRQISPVVALKLSDHSHPLYQMILLPSAPSSLPSPPSPASFAPHVFSATHAFSICCSWWARP